MPKRSSIKARMDRLGKSLVKTDAVVKAAQQRKDELAEIHNSISTAIEKEARKPVQLQLSWMPTKTARVSFFRPIADQKLKGVHTDIKRKSAWGSLLVFGPGLNIVDEGIFLSVLQCVKDKRRPTVKLNFSHLCRLLGITVHSKNTKRIKKGLIKLAQTSFTFEMKGGKWAVKHVLTDASGNNDMTVISLDPWLYDQFLSNEITLINLPFRQSLRGDITKSLYRFLVSHRGTQRYTLETLTSALNMDAGAELFRTRDRIKRAFGQLRNKGFLSFKFRADLFYDIRIMDKKQLEG